MKKKFLLGICVFVFALFGFNSFAEASVFPIETQTLSASTCPIVPSYKDPTFCDEFKTTVICNCHQHFPSRLWPVSCASVTEVYQEMIGFYGSINSACTSKYGKGDKVDILECRNQWHCDIFGTNASGGVCPGNPTTGQPCHNIS